MKIANYCGKNIRDVLDTAPYEWLATGTFGVERTLENGLLSNILLVYVRQKEFGSWRKYLASKNIQPTKILPDLKLIGADSLPDSAKNDKHVVDISCLLVDLATLAPRYKETHPDVIRRLKEAA